MKFKFKFLMSFSLFLLSVLLFVSCNGNTSSDTEPDVTEALKIAYPISEYTIIRPEKASEALVRKAVELRKYIADHMDGEKLSILDDWVKGGVITEDITNAKEILIGNTTRSESALALEGVDTTSFVIKIIGNKIVINAANTSKLFEAIDYFCANCTDISDGSLMLPENYSYISDPVEKVDIIVNDAEDVKIIYLDSLDNQISAGNENDRLDLDVVYAKDLREAIENVIGIKISLGTDWFRPDTDISANKEFLIGNTERAETITFLKDLNYNQYGFAVYGNKVVITGWNETTTELALNSFIAYFKENVIKGSDGTYSFSMLAGERMVFDSENWYVDYPVFDGAECKGTQDAGYGNLQAYFTDTTLDAYNNYCNKLEDSGFKLYMENTLNNNVHKAYTSDAGMLYVYYIPTEKCVRIVSCADRKYNLPEYTTPESVPAYEKIAEPSITQMSLSYSSGNFGLCHFITLEDGSFIVYDGGGNSNSDYERIYETLKKLNKRTDGKIVIAAWILTHEHWDHYTNFSTFCKNYSNKIKLEGMYCNTPSGSFAYNGYNPNYYMTQDFDNMSSTLGGVKKYIVHTGMKFYIRNACIEVLYTQEDLYPTKLYYFNDCTLVTRVTIDGQTITYLGDVRYEGSDIMCDRYGASLKSDIVQVSHHGYDGGTVELYKLLSPKTCLWPSPMKDYEKFTNGSTSGYMAVNTFIFKTLKVQTNIFAEPTATIALPFNTGDKITYWEY